MNDDALNAILTRERVVVAAALAAITLLAWAYVLWLAAHMNTLMPAPAMDMSGMGDMPGMDMSAMMQPAFVAWTLPHFLFMFGMWAVMMVGMMTPSAAPMILIYAQVAHQAATLGKSFVSSAWFASGYLLAWTAFALLATLAQWGLERAALLSPMMESSSHIFGGVVLIAAGLFQWIAGQAGLPCALPRAAFVRAAAWRFQTGYFRRGEAGHAARRLLRRLLLGTDGAAVRRWRDEPALDRGADDLRAGGKNHSGRTIFFAYCRIDRDCRWRAWMLLHTTR